MSFLEAKPLYCNSLFQYQRNKTFEVKVGNLVIGGLNPIRVQSMTTTNTLDEEATAEQSIRICQAGGELVRITTQGRREASALEGIIDKIHRRGFSFPLVADIHFNPNAANIAATWVEKVRINPGNFTDGAKKFRNKVYSDDEYQTELQEIRNKLLPFLNICKKHNTAVRIGANHGSLSDRIMARYGDNPKGMVESCMEYLRICREVDFHNIVLSIKSSNTRVMVQTVRLLVATMKSEGMNYPLHLGVTEAGSGEDGRVKSAVGIGALMADGLGDTIRVSLTEEPEMEIPVARELVTHFDQLTDTQPVVPVSYDQYHPYEYVHRQTHVVAGFGGDNPVAVMADVKGKEVHASAFVPDAVLVDFEDQPLPDSWSQAVRIINYSEGIKPSDKRLVLFSKEEWLSLQMGGPKMVALTENDIDDSLLRALKNDSQVVIYLSTNHRNGVAAQRAFFLWLLQHELTHPVVVARSYRSDDEEKVQITAAADTGMLFLDGFGDGLSLNLPNLSSKFNVELMFGILQASRVRFSKTEYISCPGCGRTLFDLQSTTALVRAKTGHLKGLKMAVMGCIVNGIGEMADADYGYVGAGPGKISLFRNRELVLKAIPQEQAVDKLVELIRENGDWVDPE
ncbi:(E)-4-hydroxy-3-methylbut-2-enyl-diphosphate synthase [Geofilum sp. OHC36d9]|uniref:(E)-4-hydroxy-3-methylbut-2-enyl-diphosphate synthase n=1 Tax=Geofilum sp. OHC36d9 TaxID=3458413 RepID=UPI004033B51A